MQQDYDAFEFMTFMAQFLKDHPEVLKDQQAGWDIYWNPRKTEQKQVHFHARDASAAQ
jgi:hypothetical protein